MTDREQIAALTARAERAETLLGERRMCLNCGRTAPASHDRNTPLDDCLTDDACAFDMTPDEAWQHWRRVAHDLRVRAEAAEAALARVEGERDVIRQCASDWCDAVGCNSSWDGWDHHYKHMKHIILPSLPQHPAPADQGGEGGDNG